MQVFVPSLQEILGVSGGSQVGTRFFLAMEKKLHAAKEKISAQLIFLCIFFVLFSFVFF